MDFSPLLFKAQDAQLILDGGPRFVYDNSFKHAIGRLPDISERANSCPLCKMIANVIQKHVNGDFLATIEADKSYHWQLTLGSFGTFEPSRPSPPSGTSLLRMDIVSIKAFTDGQSRADGVALDYIIQGAERLIPWAHDLDATYTGALRPSGRFYKPQCESGLFRKWLQECEKNHTYRCVNRSNAISKLSFRLIDVQALCLQELDCTKDNLPRYFALSYVWGMKKQSVQLTLSSLPDLVQNGALARQELPRTVSDAIYLVKALGERYLWVDALCIVQDDPEDKKSQIPLMRDIYSRAVLTIVAASGDNADSGLAGLRSERTFQQEAVILDNVSLINCCSPVPSFQGTYLLPTKWNSRGWTMQESLLSMRCLIFTEEQVNWQCRTACLCEEARLETAPELRFWNRRFDTFFLRPEDPQYPIYNFKQLLPEYTSRQLSYDGDALDAFFGVLEFFEYQGNLKCLWGVPIT